MKNHDKILLMDLNLAEYQREMTRWNADGEILEQNDLLLTKSSRPFPTTCVAMYLNVDTPAPATEIFHHIHRFYKKRCSPFSIHIRKHADKTLEDVCRREKMVSISDSNGMALEQPLPEKPAPKGCNIRHINDLAGLNDFTCVVKDSYQSLRMPPHVAEHIFETPSRLLRPHLDWVVGYEAGLPVSIAMALYSHGIAGLYWVGTLQNKRGRGYAEACVREVTNEAFRRGAALVALQASKFGEPIYERMGFDEVTRYPWYVCFEP